MLTSLYHTHGYFCASHPWEIIIGSVTIVTCLLSASVFTAGSSICGLSSLCGQSQTEDGSELMLLSVTRCLAVMYIYLQFRNVRHLGSKCLYGISGTLMITSSLLLTLVLVKVVGGNVALLTDALPFFLLLVDLSKACVLAKYALKSKSQDEVQSNIAEGIAVLGPAITLDTICELLVIGVGTLSGVEQLQSVCCYGCLSVIAHYLAFMIFYPACLSLIMEISRSKNQGITFLKLQQLARSLDKEDEKKPNPVIQHIKIIMSFGLIIVHVHSRYLAEGSDNSQFTSLLTTTKIVDREKPVEMTALQYFILRMFTHHIDYTFMLVLGVFLIIKYMFYDESIQEELRRTLEIVPRAHNISDTHRDRGSQTMNTVDSDSLHNDETDFQKAPVVSFTKPEQNTKFHIGDNSDTDEEDNKLDVGVQTEIKMFKPLHRLPSTQPARPLQECVDVLNSDGGPSLLTDEEVINLVKSRHIPAYKLENMLNDFERGVSIRRDMLITKLKSRTALDNLPFSDYAYEFVNGACCENVIGYMPVPVGVAGPLLLDGKYHHVPMATTEGCLVASTNRGCKALEQGGGVTSMVINNGMTRAPVVRFHSARDASEAKAWLANNDNYEKLKECFDTTSRFARLSDIHTVQAGHLLYIRFIAVTGDAMGMNMLSKGAEKALGILSVAFPDMDILSLSGNFCTDKKPAAVNWLEGRGKSVVCEAVIPGHIVKTLLKTSVEALVDLNISKNLVGSAMAGSIGGFNAHAANIVTAIFIATGQDPAQTVTSSNCITLMEATGTDKSDLRISCTMPSIEVGTVGGGTVLPPQASCLEMLGIRGSCSDNPGENAKVLATIICGTVLAGELSLMSALAAGHLVRSHLKHNRSTLNVAPNQNNSALSQPSSMLQQETIKKLHSYNRVPVTGSVNGFSNASKDLDSSHSKISNSKLINCESSGQENGAGKSSDRCGSLKQSRTSDNIYTDETIKGSYPPDISVTELRNQNGHHRSNLNQQHTSIKCTQNGYHSSNENNKAYQSLNGNGYHSNTDMRDGLCYKEHCNSSMINSEETEQILASSEKDSSPTCDRPVTNQESGVNDITTIWKRPVANGIDSTKNS